MYIHVVLSMVLDKWSCECTADIIILCVLACCIYNHVLYCFVLVLYGATFCVPNTVPEATVLLAGEWKGCQALFGLHPDSNMVFFIAIVLIF